MSIEVGLCREARPIREGPGQQKGARTTDFSMHRADPPFCLRLAGTSAVIQVPGSTANKSTSASTTVDRIMSHVHIARSVSITRSFYVTRHRCRTGHRACRLRSYCGVSPPNWAASGRRTGRFDAQIAPVMLPDGTRMPGRSLRARPVCAHRYPRHGAAGFDGCHVAHQNVLPRSKGDAQWVGSRARLR